MLGCKAGRGGSFLMKNNMVFVWKQFFVTLLGGGGMSDEKLHALFLEAIFRDFATKHLPTFSPLPFTIFRGQQVGDFIFEKCFH